MWWRRRLRCTTGGRRVRGKGEEVRGKGRWGDGASPQMEWMEQMGKAVEG